MAHADPPSRKTQRQANERKKIIAKRTLNSNDDIEGLREGPAPGPTPSPQGRNDIIGQSSIRGIAARRIVFSFIFIRGILNREGFWELKRNQTYSTRPYQELLRYPFL